MLFTARLPGGAVVKVTAIAAAPVMVTLADTDLVGSAVEAALMVTAAGGTLAGAV
jgi:hypothetical protein